MYTCHICHLKSKLNILMSSHYKKAHHNIDKHIYKKDLLIANGRYPKTCPICNKETTIPKGEHEYPKYHKKCYITNIYGKNNPNYKDGKAIFTCEYCKKQFKKYKSMVVVEYPFCSTSCSMNFYASLENRTDNQLINDKIQGERLKEITKTDKFKKAHVKALVKMQKDKKSKIEERFFNELKKIYPSAIEQYVYKYYIFDAYIPEINTIFEVNGNYWHNIKEHRVRDIKKSNFIKNNTTISIRNIWENDINSISNEKLITYAFKKVNVYLVVGLSDCNKSYVIDKLSTIFNIVDNDKIQSIDKCIDICKNNNTKPYLLIASTDIKQIIKKFINNDIRIWSCYIQESNNKYYESLKDKVFQFYGSQETIIKWLTNHIYTL